MSQAVLPLPRSIAAAPALFAGAVFMSAALVFLVEPLMGRLILPALGGSPAVWNTSLAFFQAALLIGYGYAHLLQRLRSARVQAAIHLAVLAVAALALPLHLSRMAGEPPAGAPIPWLLAVLALSIGAPFVALSATAPLVQAWYARLREGDPDGGSPYVLYAASNLGSLIALIAYPLVVEPMLALSAQRTAWTVGYGLFAVLAVGLSLLLPRSQKSAHPGESRDPGVFFGGRADVIKNLGPGFRRDERVESVWADRGRWVFLAAAPSSLMLGVTSHLSTDVASAPFLWVVPLALYLLTFVVAFQARPSIGPATARLLQAVALVACVILLPMRTGGWLVQLAVHLSAFFLTALVCAQALAARKPEPARLTEFYLWMSLGGVIGGSFNAFLAPVIFSQVWEYPLAFLACSLARPWGGRSFDRPEIVVLVCGLVAALVAGLIGGINPMAATTALGLVCITGLAAYRLKDRAPLFTVLIAAVILSGQAIGGKLDTLEVRRSFFGVHRVAEVEQDGLGRVRLLFNGTTLHGAQGLGAGRCTPMTYYAPAAPIGQVFAARTAAGAAPLRIGAVGLGAGAVASYTRAGDTLRFFEIDPAVVAIARDSGAFSYVHDCAHGDISYVTGDARRTLAAEPAGGFDLLLIDAFSSDSVPTHLMTVEAIRADLAKLAPGGVLLMHLTNRNLRLVEPAAAAARAAGAVALVQAYQPAPPLAPPAATRSTVLALARDPAALESLRRDPRWRIADPKGVTPWTDDYVNVVGALIARMRDPSDAS